MVRTLGRQRPNFKIPEPGPNDGTAGSIVPGACAIAANSARIPPGPLPAARHPYKAAPFRRNDVLLNFLPKGLVAFPGSGITNNLVDKARKIGTRSALDQAAPLAGWDLPPAFQTLCRLMEARSPKAGRREYVQVLRLLESFGLEDLHDAVKDALRLGAIGFDAVKHLVLCRVEKRPPKLDLDVYPYLPGRHRLRRGQASGAVPGREAPAEARPRRLPVSAEGRRRQGLGRQLHVPAVGGRGMTDSPTSCWHTTSRP